MKKLIAVIGLALFAGITAQAQVTAPSMSLTNDQSGTLAGIFTSNSTNGWFASAEKGVSDAAAFVEGNTNGWARISVEGGWLHTQSQGNGGFLNLLIPLSGTNNILGAGFGIAELNHNWYDTTLNARLGTSIPIKLGGLDLTRLLPLYVYGEAGGGYNFGTRAGIAQTFAGSSLHYSLYRTHAGNTVDLTVGYAIGTISDIKKNVQSVGGSVSFSF